MYVESARVYDALFRNKDYQASSVVLRELVQRLVPQANSLLDVACGTGRYLSCLSDHFRVEGLDLSAEMLEVARQRCPNVPLHEGNMVDFHLNGLFDVVTCLFGSIGYARTVDDLRRAIQCMASHVRDEGALIVEPWITPERFVNGKLVFDSVNDPDLKVARIYVTRCEGRISIFDSDYLVGTVEGVAHFSERQELGLFTDTEYREAFRLAGVDVVDVADDLFGYGLYAGRVRRSPNRTI